MTKKLFGAIAIIIFQCTALWAQSNLSVEYPGGLPINHSTGLSESMGGAGVGIRNDFMGMADNVGNLGATDRAVFSGLLSFNISNINDNGQNAMLSSFSPALFSFAIPITSIGTFGFSFNQRSTIDFNVYATAPGDNGFLDSTRIVGIGGIKSWEAGWGHAIGNLGFFGVSYERVYFSGFNITKYVSSNVGASGMPLSDSQSYSSGSNGIKAGFLIPIQKLTIGVNGEYIFNGQATKRFKSTIPDVNDTVGVTIGDTTNFSLALPPSLSLGASYAFSPRWLLAASSAMTFWNLYSSGEPLGVNSPQEVHNVLSFSAGGQYIPAPNMLLPQYWEIMQYHAGARYIQLPDGHSSERALDLGISLPLLKGGGLVDLIAEYGQRSDSRFSGYSENFWQFSIGINGGGSWAKNTGVHY